MVDYKLPIITGTSLTVGDLLRWDGNNWVNYPDSNYTGHQFVDRGDPAAEDLDETDLTYDGNWNDLDFGPGGLGIVPAGAVAIYLRVGLRDVAAQRHLFFRKNGNANTENITGIRTQVANVYCDGMWPVFCDANGIVEYFTTDIDPATYDIVKINVLGWWI